MVELPSPMIRVMLTLCVVLGGATLLTRHTSWSRQVSSWWRLMPAAFLAAALGPWGVKALVLLIGGLAVRELVPHAEDSAFARRVLWTAWWVQAAADLLMPWLSVALGAFTALGSAIWYRRRRPKLGLLLALFALQSAGLGCLLLLTDVSPAPGSAAAWFIYLCTVTALNDIGQFVVGKVWGRSALAATVSPNKTRQGAGGGLALGTVVSVWVGSVLGLGTISELAVLGVVLCILGTLGDLLFSAAKRALRIKDFSDLIPGHGGILDRVDSLVLTAPTLLLALHLSRAVLPP